LATVSCVLALAGPGRPHAPSAADSWIDGEADAALRALETAPPTREVDLDRAVVQLYSGQSVQAAASLEELRRREGGWTPALRWLARAQAELGRPEAAASAQALLAKKDVEVLDQLWAGDVFLRLGRSQQAGAAYEAALRRSPGIELDWRRGVAQAPAATADAPWLGRLLAASSLRGGERLRYTVKYLFLRLATVTLETGHPEFYAGVPARRLVFTAKLNDGVPFFHIDSRFESVVGEDGAVLAHRHVASDSDAGADQAGYDMDAGTGRCTVRTARDGVFGYHVLPLPANAQDGVSVLQIARALARARSSAVVPTAVDGLWWPTELRTLGVERIRWRGRDVPAVRMRSVGRYRGAGGMSGGVDIWMSDDERSVPYRVKMKVAVGSVTLELLPDEALVASGAAESEVTR
jgi:hypothetical protein